jgi:adenine deaminase
MLLANPTEFAGVLLRHGTTTAVVDALPLMLLARPSHLSSLLDELAALPMKFRWLIRLHPQSFADTGERFALPTLRALWRAPFAAAVGEVTGWVDVLQGDPDLLAKIRAAREDGRRVEGHAAGASYERLAALAEAGFTSCHEAITADEVRDRLRAGLVTMLRHSSIRPDLPDLVRGITSEDIAAGRVMLTADGPTPVFIADHGYLDYLLEVAISAGVHPMDALRMVTVNPARYYGMRNLGEIAVGTQADINVVRDLRRPTPSLVIANGTIAAKDGMLLARMPTPAWDAAFEPATIPRLPADVFTTAGAATPGIRMINDVITEPVPAPDLPPTALRVALLDRRGRWIIQTRLVGFADRLGGLATTISSGFDIVILGQHPPDMARALAAVADMGGGLVVTDGGRVFSLPLELGAFSLQSWTEVVDANRQFNLMLQERGYRFADPVFSLLFLTFDSLPWIRLTSRGVWDVRNRRVLAASRPL